MELSKLLEAMQELTAPDYIAERTSDRGQVPEGAEAMVRLEIPEAVYDQAVEMVQNLKAADLLNYKAAQAAHPKLVQAVQLVLAIADHPFRNPTERVELAPKTRKQLEAALRIAGKS